MWDNISARELVAEGASYWPYQTAQVLVSTKRVAALLPGDMRGRFDEHAALAQKHCLSCHQVNGYGGEKLPINLAQTVKTIERSVFQRWVLSPAQVKPGTTMPALPDGMPIAQRRAVADKLFDYLQALPVAR